MEGSNDTQKLVDDTRTLAEDSRQVIDDVQRLYDRMRDEGSIADHYEDNPFAVLAAAAGAGYILGGGLFTPFTKRILKIGMKGLVIPLASAQIKHLTSAGHPSELPFEGER